MSGNDRLIAVDGGGGGRSITDADCLPEFGVGWTAAGMVGVEESDNVIARRLFILIVTSDRGAAENSRGYCRGIRILPAERQQKEEFSSKILQGITASSLARQVRGSAEFALPSRKLLASRISYFNNLAS